MEHWAGEERRVRVTLTEDQINEIVEKTVEQVFQRMYADVGRGAIKKLAWISGAILMGLLLWLSSTGHMKVP